MLMCVTVSDHIKLTRFDLYLALAQRPRAPAARIPSNQSAIARSAFHPNSIRCRVSVANSVVILTNNLVFKFIILSKIYSKYLVNNILTSVFYTIYLAI